MRLFDNISYYVQIEIVNGNGGAYEVGPLSPGAESTSSSQAGNSKS